MCSIANNYIVHVQKTLDFDKFFAYSTFHSFSRLCFFAFDFVVLVLVLSGFAVWKKGCLVSAEITLKKNNKKVL